MHIYVQEEIAEECDVYLYIQLLRDFDSPQGADCHLSMDFFLRGTATFFDYYGIDTDSRDFSIRQR